MMVAAISGRVALFATFSSLHQHYHPQSIMSSVDEQGFKVCSFYARRERH